MQDRSDVDIVSIIICNWNYGRYLHECLDSVVNQTYRPIQIVFVDDGSTDNSIEIFKSKLETFEKNDIEHESFYYDNNGGRIRSLNRAIEIVKGEYSTILDSDDMLHDKFIETSKDALVKERTIDTTMGFVYTNLDIIDKYGKVISHGLSDEFDTEKVLLYSYIPDCGLTYTHALKECYPFDETVMVNTKHHKWQKIVRAGWKGKLLHKRLYKYRIHDCNISGINRRITSADRTKLIEKWNPHKESWNRDTASVHNS